MRRASLSTALLSSAALLLPLLWSAQATALPRMSLTAGTPCSACHVNGQGGGMRTEIGWGTSLYTGAYIPELFEENESNQFFDGLLSVGIDARLQVARLGRPDQDTNALPDRVVFPMQLQPYLSSKPTEWLTLYATYNIDRSVYNGNGLCNPTYAGQSCTEAMVKVQPSYTAPYIRVGNLQPNIGIRHDDHTMLVRGDASTPRIPTIAPNYAELGADLTYTPAYWFQADTGAYRAAKLSEAIGDSEVVNRNDVAYSGRIQVMPRLDDLKLVSWVGASIYGAGSWHMENYFVGVGRLDTASLMFELSRTDRGKERDHNTLNFMTKLDVPIKEWIVLSGRYERGTAHVNDVEQMIQQAVVGLEFFPIPYVELRPEYRYIRTDAYQMAQYTMQLHMFY